MWRALPVVVVAALALFSLPAERTEAGLAACILTAQDVDIDTLGFNYLWGAAVGCTGEDWEKAHISVDLEYYDWGEEEWRFLSVAGAGTSYDEEDMLVWGAAPVPPYLGINCRRIDAAFFFTHSGRNQNFTEQSNSECY